MDWARDHNQILVQASQGGFSKWGLTCPTCLKPVFLRSGDDRRPHFAHKKYSANIECENYHPPPNSIVQQPGAMPGIDRIKRDSLSCGLFLMSKPGTTSLSLMLRIPPLDLGENAQGQLEILTRIGQKPPFDLGDLVRARLVPLEPAIPLAEIKGFGDLLGLATHVKNQISAFTIGRNLFYADVREGRFVFENELLECGTRYRLLSAIEVIPPLELRSELNWKSLGKLGTWYSYEFELPTFDFSSKPSLREGIKKFLGHDISKIRPRIYIVDPLPHHVDIDGTYVYPMSLTSILLSRSGGGKVAVTSFQSQPHVSVTELEHGWIQLDGFNIRMQEYTISIDGNEQAIIRTEEDCDLFLPGGITVTVDELSWDLCTDAPMPASDLSQRETKIHCVSDRIAYHLKKLNNKWNREGTQLSLPRGEPKVLDAGSFGQLRDIVEPPLEAHSHKLPTLEKQRWIEQLVIKIFGIEGVNRLRLYLSDPNPVNLHYLGPIMTSYLLPYIRAEHDRQYHEKFKGT